MKELVKQKKLTMWKEVVEKTNVDFEGSRKEFWVFVGRRTKVRNRSIASLKVLRECLSLVQKASWKCYRSIISIWVGLV